MFDRRKIEAEVRDYAGEFVADYDVDAIVDELYEIDPEISSIDDIDPDELTDVIARHDVSGR